MQENQKVIYIFLLFFFLLLIVFTRYVYIAFGKRDLNRIFTEKKDRGKRGSVITADGYKVAITEKLYTATVDLENIPPANKDVFIQMFSIYSGISQAKILHKLDSKERGIVFLAKNLHFQEYQNLKDLAIKLRSSGLLSGVYTKRKKYKFIGLQMYETGNFRKYPYGKTLTPLIGFTNKKDNKIKGIKGLEARFDEDMKPGIEGYTKGFKDLKGQLILNNKINKQKKEEGSDIYLNID